MRIFTKSPRSSITEKLLLKPYIKFSSSIYGRVVYLILGTSVFLFLSFSIIFRSVNEQYLNTVIRQNGNNIGSIVRGSLYQSMLENDKSTLQNTLDIINTMSGIDEVNMYDTQNNLVYSSIPPTAAEGHADPNCLTCHSDFQTMFPGDETQYRVLSIDSDCKMNANGSEYRLLLIKVPILNETSCYESSCHAHRSTDKVLGSLIIKIPLEELDMAEKKSSAEFFLLATITTTFLIVVLIVFTRRRIKDPLNDLVRASTAVANGDKTMRLEIKPNQLEDMKLVSRAFNEMLDNLQSVTDELQNWSQQLEYKVQKKSEELSAAQNELIHIERLASLGKLSSSVAHEINNPLSGILIYTKLIYKQLSNPELFTVKRESILKHLKLIENEAKRCGDIVKGLLEFSRKDQEDFEPRHMHDILRETYELMTHPFKIANIHCYTDFTATNDLINCSPNQIKQACVAMLVNSSEAMMEKGEIIIRTFNPDAETIRVEIIDNGIGISPVDLPHIFEPFFSTKQSASGIGLGLAIVHGIIQSHKAEIQVRSEPGKGATFTITIPLIKH